MMLLPNHEMEALNGVLVRFNQHNFDAFLVRIGGPPISSFSSPLLSMPAIVVDFNAWLQLHREFLPTILEKLAVEVGASTEASVLASAADKLWRREQKVKALGPPTQVRLAGGVPIVNRSVLRAHLQAAIDDADDPNWDVKFVKVLGERCSGRSHSWHLIKYVADSGVGEAIKFDLESPTLANQTLEVLFHDIVKRCRLANVEKPTEVGVTSDTLAARYAEEVARCLSGMSASWSKPKWLVFDSLDRELRPEIKRFVSLLVQARLDKAFDRCVIFLLGPDAITEPADPWQMGRTEELVPFSDEEIDDAANYLHKLGAARLSSDTLQKRIAAMRALRSTCRAGELYKQVGAHLLQLRIMVRA